MALRRLLIAAALAAAAAPPHPAAGFYLPGLAPVNFCEAGKEKAECRVRARRGGGVGNGVRGGTHTRRGLGAARAPEGPVCCAAWPLAFCCGVWLGFAGGEGGSLVWLGFFFSFFFFCGIGSGRVSAGGGRRAGESCRYGYGARVGTPGRLISRGLFFTYLVESCRKYERQLTGRFGGVRGPREERAADGRRQVQNQGERGVRLSPRGAAWLRGSEV